MTPKELKTLRAKAGISQFRLAALSGVSRYNIALLELGYREFKNNEAETLKGVLSGNKNKKIRSK